MIYTLLSYIWIVASIPFVFYSVIRLSGELQLLQRQGYRNHRYRLGFMSGLRSHLRELIPLAAPVPLLLLGGTVPELVALFLWVLAFALMLKNREKAPGGKLLRVTDRALRLYVASLLLYFIPVVLLVFLVVANVGAGDVLRGICLAVLAILPFLAPFFVLAANFLLQPWEKRHNRRYSDEAEELLKEYPQLIKIVVTDDNAGAMSILGRMLAEKYCILQTGTGEPGTDAVTELTKVIREELKPHHQVLLTAINAEQEGDIQELCGLLSPRYGLLTAVGEGVTAVAGESGATVYPALELIDSLPENGVAVMNFDADEIRGNAHRMQGVAVSYGIHAKNPDFRAENIVYREQGTEFTLCAGDGSTVELRTRLTGEENLSALVGAAALAMRLGITLKQIKRAVLTILPPESAERNDSAKTDSPTATGESAASQEEE